VDIADEVELLRRMVEIDSVTGQERQLADFLADRLAGLGFAASVDAVGNVVGEIGDPDGPLIMLLGHIDTVGGEVPRREVGPLLYGRGSIDAKGPFATMISAAHRVGSSIRARIVVVGAVDEEGQSAGAHHLVDRYAPRAVVIGEPSGVHCVVTGYKGVLRFGYDVTRPLTHTSSPEEKATEVAASFWQRLVTMLLDRYPDGPLFDRAIPTLVAFAGDLTRAHLEVSCRLPIGLDGTAFRAELEELAGDATIVVRELTAAVRVPRNDPVARALTAAIRRQGGTPVIRVKLGTSDMNVVGPQWNVPIATYGPGESRFDHTPDEHIDLRDYRAAVDILADALRDLAGTLAEAAPNKERQAVLALKR
jgi:LysW-gamma-L-lysine carboxypeptidase